MQKARSQEPEAPSYRLQAHGFRFCFTRRQAFFSPFPHGTGALSVTDEYSALEGGPPRFQRGFSCPAVLRCQSHSLWLPFAYGALTLFRAPSQTASAKLQTRAEQVPLRSYNPGATWTPVWAGPVSLAATPGISVDFFSWGYLDVSVLPVGPRSHE